MTTPKLGLDEIAESQSNKYATHNEALRGVDALLPKVAISVTHTPPGSPANGDVYIISSGSPSATGAWAGQNGSIAWYNGEWNFVTPEYGWTIWVQGDDADWRFDGSNWGAVPPSGLTVEDEGSVVTGGPHTTLNFTGAGVQVTNAGGGEATVNVTGGGGGVSASEFSGANIYATVAQSLPNATETAIEFDTEFFDTDAYFLAGSPGHPTRITVPETGYYSVRGFARLNGAGLTGRLQAYIRKNGSGSETGLLVQDMGGETNLSISVTGLIQLTGGDYIELIVSQTSGSSVDTLAGSAQQYPRLEISKIAGIGGVQATFSGMQAYRSTTQTIANNTTTDIAFDTQVFDTDNYFTANGSPDTTGGVIPVDGYYLILAQVRWANNSSGRRQFNLKINGTIYAQSEVEVNALQGEAMQVQFLGQLSSGDVISAEVFQTSGGNLDLLAGSESQYPRITITRITASGVTLDNEAYGSPSITDQYHNIAIGTGLNLEHLGDGLARLSSVATGSSSYEDQVTTTTLDGNSKTIADTSSAAVAYTLPTGVNGQFIRVVDGAHNAATNNITMTPQTGEAIEGVANDTAVIDVDGGALELVYSTVDSRGWIVADSASATQGSSTFSGVQIKTDSLQSIPDSTTEKVEFEYAVYDTDSYFDSAGSPSDTIMVPEAGYYLVHFECTYAANTTGFRTAYIYVNGSAVALQRYAAATSNITTVHAIRVLSLSANDILSFYCRQDSGGSLNIGTATDLFATRATITRQR